MILSHFKDPVNGQPPENTFVALEEITDYELASCVLYRENKPALFPRRPFRVRMELKGEQIPDKLLGAAVTRARLLCLQSGVPSRIYAPCAPNDTGTLDALKPLGFVDSDGLVRMQLDLPCKAEPRLPESCVVIYDDLSDPMEQKYFLERYNELYGTDRDFEWLHKYTFKDSFTRILTVSPTGLAGEVVLWEEKGVGVIDHLQTARKWRRLGIAKCMLALACETVSGYGLDRIRADVRVRIPYALHTLESVGFKQSELLMRYPCVDIDP